MTKTRSTKRALLMSALALFLCVSMLVGTTFAWFTDSVTSAGNKIVAGTLEVDLLMADASGNYASIAGKEAAIFGGEDSLIAKNDAANTLWEPGKTQIVYLGVENKGNLDLKYNIALNVTDGGLIGALEYAVVDGAKHGDLSAATDWATLKAAAQTGDVAAGTTIAAPNGEIKSDEDVEYFALAVHMKEEAGNQYKGKDITIDITVLATQLASEFDSFDNQYDVDADYVVEVKTADELAIALRTGGFVKLVNDLSIAESLTVPAGVNATVDLNGKALTATTSLVNVFVNEGELTIVGSGKITTRNLLNRPGAKLVIDGDITVVGGAPTAGSAVWNEGDCVIKNVTIEQVNTSNYAIQNVTDNSTMVIENAKVVSKHGAITNLGANASLVVNGGYYEVTGASTDHVIYAPAGTVTINGGSYNLSQANASSLGSTIIDVDGTVTINGGTFDSVSGAFAYNADSVLVIKGGTFMNKAATVYGGDFAQFVANGYVATKNADGTYTVVKGATVTDVTDLKGALDVGGNIVLAEDIALTETLTAKKDVVIDLNGNTMTTPSGSSMFKSSSDTDPSIIITSSTAGAEINVSGGDTSVLLGYGSTLIENVTINVAGCDNYSPNPFNVYGDLTLGEGTVVNVDYLGTSLINNNGAVDIVIDGAEINIGTFKTNGGSVISLNQASTLEMKNTNVKIENFVPSTFGGEKLISKVNGVTIDNCTFVVTGSDNASYNVVVKSGATGDYYGFAKN